MPHGESELVCRRKVDTPTPPLRPTPVCPAPPAEAAPPALSMGGTGPSPLPALHRPPKTCAPSPPPGFIRCGGAPFLMIFFELQSRPRSTTVPAEEPPLSSTLESFQSRSLVSGRPSSRRSSGGHDSARRTG